MEVESSSFVINEMYNLAKTDRIYQAKLKDIIEPCYETIAETNTYGFRPMRSTKDTIEAIFNALRFKEEAWILEGDRIFR